MIKLSCLTSVCICPTKVHTVFLFQYIMSARINSEVPLLTYYYYFLFRGDRLYKTNLGKNVSDRHFILLSAFNVYLKFNLNYFTLSCLKYILLIKRDLHIRVCILYTRICVKFSGFHHFLYRDHFSRSIFRIPRKLRLVTKLFTREMYK